LRQLNTDRLTTLLAEQQSPCISLYQPTHRHRPDNQQDPIRYKNLLTQMETSLLEKYPPRTVQSIMERFQELAGDSDFWNHRTDGLVILSSPDTFEIFDLQRPIEERLIIGNSFHVKPLLRVLQSADRYQILCLNRHEAKLYEGNRDALDPVDLEKVPSTITEALGSELTDPHTTVASYGSGAGGSDHAMHHGHGGKKDEVDNDMDRFFRSIDRGISEHHSRPSGLPLMLAALTEYHTPFRELSHNPMLMADGLMMNPEGLSLDELRVKAWQIVEPLYLARLAKLVDNYQVSKSQQLGSDDLSDAVQAAQAGRISVLLLEADRQEMLDDLAEATLRMKGEVVIVPAERMPTTTGLAATYRF